PLRREVSTARVPTLSSDRNMSGRDRWRRAGPYMVGVGQTPVSITQNRGQTPHVLWTTCDQPGEQRALVRISCRFEVECPILSQKFCNTSPSGNGRQRSERFASFHSASISSRSECFGDVSRSCRRSSMYSKRRVKVSTA